MSNGPTDGLIDGFETQRQVQGMSWIASGSWCLHRVSCSLGKQLTNVVHSLNELGRLWIWKWHADHHNCSSQSVRKVDAFRKLGSNDGKQDRSRDEIARFAVFILLQFAEDMDKDDNKELFQTTYMQYTFKLAVSSLAQNEDSAWTQDLARQLLASNLFRP